MKNTNIHLVAYYTAHPRDPKLTKLKGYMTNPDNLRYDEQVEFTYGLPQKKLLKAKVVLNLSEKKVVRNGWASEKSFDELFKHFHSGYDKYLNAVMTGLDADYLESMTGVRLQTNNGNETTNEQTEEHTSESAEPVQAEAQTSA